MNESNSQAEKPKGERRYDPDLLKKGLRCDLDQYEMLKRCSEKKDMTEWNQRRKKYRTEDVLLEGAKFQNLFMDQVCLDEDAANRPGKVYLKDAVFSSANLNKARFMKADLRGCDFHHAQLNEAILILADIRDADLSYAQLRGAKFPFVIVNEKTRFFNNGFDRRTWFWGVGLGNMRIAPEVKVLLEHNIRKIKWQQWYKYKDWYNYETYPQNERGRVEKFFAKWILRFLEISDYGLSTGRIIAVFLVSAFAFALMYWLLPSTVIVNGTVGDLRGLWHALYFSVVTMTTLGFGDIAANPDSWLGQTLLMIHVIWGYVLLGALVTRFAVLFTAGGPAGKFADEKTIWQRLKERWNRIKKKG